MRVSPPCVSPPQVLVWGISLCCFFLCVSPTVNLRRQITFPSNSVWAAWNNVLDEWWIPRLFTLFFFLNASLVSWQCLHFNSAFGFCLWKELGGTWTASLVSTVVYSAISLPQGCLQGEERYIGSQDTSPEPLYTVGFISAPYGKLSSCLALIVANMHTCLEMVRNSNTINTRSVIWQLFSTFHSNLFFFHSKI